MVVVVKIAGTLSSILEFYFEGLEFANNKRISISI